MEKISVENTIKDLTLAVSTQGLVLSESALQIFQEFEQLGCLYDNPPGYPMMIIALLRQSDVFQAFIQEAGRDCASLEELFTQQRIPELRDDTDSYSHPRHAFPYSSRNIIHSNSEQRRLLELCVQGAKQTQSHIIQDIDIISAVLEIHDEIHPIEDNRDWRDEKLQTPYNTLSHILGAYDSQLDIEFGWLRGKIAHYQRIHSPQADFSYINRKRIEELKNLSAPAFDLQKLLRLCEELNACYEQHCYFALAILTRTLVDHIPPIFGVRTFSEVANNYKGTKSFKQSMEHLEQSSRKIADRFLHDPVRKKEVLPNFTQVNFSNDVDILLQEIVRIL